jgi:butyrate response factor 1
LNGKVAYCEEAVDPDVWDARWVPLRVTKVEIGVKTYDIELKPLFSAFRIRALGATTVRAVLVNYLPLLEAYLQPEEDDGEEDSDRPAQLPLNPVVPLKRSATHIIREVVKSYHLLLHGVCQCPYLPVKCAAMPGPNSQVAIVVSSRKVRI